MPAEGLPAPLHPEALRKRDHAPAPGRGHRLAVEVVAAEVELHHLRQVGEALRHGLELIPTPATHCN